MSIASEITRLQNAKSTLKTKLNAKNDEQHQITNETIDEYGDFVDSIQSSNIIGATAEGESLSLANTKAMPYSDYVVKGKSEQNGEPSPSNPSEIHSVADDVNLLNVLEYKPAGTVEELNGLTFSYLNDGSIKVNGTASQDTTFLAFRKFDNLIEAGRYVFSGCTGGSYSTYRMELMVIPSYSYFHSIDGDETINLSTSQNLSHLYIIVLNGTTLNNKIFYPKFQKGTEATPYSPYNQGTVTIKQRGKNLFDVGDTSDYTGSGISNLSIQNNEISNVIDSGGASYIIQNNKLNINNFCFSGTYDRTGVAPRFLVRAYNSNNEQITSSVSGWTYNSYYNAYYKDENGNFNLSNVSYVKVGLAWKGTQGETGKYSNIQLEQGSSVTSYEPYQANNYTIQTEPLRSLPNGVKDTIEAEQHRKIGRRLLQASDIKDIVTTGTVPYVRIAKTTLGMVNGTFANNTALMRSYAITGNISYLNTPSGQFNTYYDKYFLAIFDDRFTDLETAKQLLEGEEIIYELKTEVIEPLTQNQATTMLDIIKTGSYESTTNIYTDEDVKPTMKVVYYKKA